MATPTDLEAIRKAWEEEGSQRRLGLRPSADKMLQAALIPAGGEWQCEAHEGAITRCIVWKDIEVCIVNSRGDMNDRTEAGIAMGLRAAPLMDKAMRVIFILAQQEGTATLIRDIARAAVDYTEQPAPELFEPE